MMELNRMLNQMCHEALTQAEVSAIGKARGFSQQEMASRSTFESLFLASIGLERVMPTLNAEEVATLHLLHQQKKPVNIAFFERLYGKQAYSYAARTFTQQYRDTLEAVRKNLVRKGLLVMADDKARAEDVQMERWRFRFPAEFARFLPPLLGGAQSFPTPGEVRREVVSQKIAEVLGGPPVNAATAGGAYQVELVNGSLYIGGVPLQAGALREWQEKTWEADLTVKIVAGATTPLIQTSTNLISSVRSILATLTPDAWVEPQQLSTALKIFAFGSPPPEAEKICQVGWRWGCLARHHRGEQTFYRLPAPSTDSGSLEAAFSPAPDGQSLRVNLEHTSIEILESLNALVRLQVKNQTLSAWPDPAKLSRAAPETRQSPLAHWLQETLPAFRQVFALVQERWGKVLVHSDLLVARVRDLSLRVQLERSLGEDLIVLSDEFVAFPAGWRSEVEKLLKKSGFVVKEVRA